MTAFFSPGKICNAFCWIDNDPLPPENSTKFEGGSAPKTIQTMFKKTALLEKVGFPYTRWRFSV